MNIHNVSWRINQHNFDPKFSDHFQIIITIQTDNNNEEPLYHNTWNLSSKSKWKKYNKTLTQTINNTTFSIDPNEHANQLNNIIYTTAISTIGYRKYLRGYNPWWNSQINDLKISIKRTKRKIDKIKQKYPTEYHTFNDYKQLILEYNSLNKHKTQCIRISKKQYNEYINNYLQNSKFDDKLSWRLINANKKSPQNDLPPLKNNNDIITNPISKAEILHKTLSNPNPPELKHKHKQFQKQISSIISKSQIKTHPPIFGDILNAKIELCEIKNCIHDLNKDKACGPDQIHNQMIMNGGPSFIQNLLTLFNKCLSKGTFPNIWNNNITDPKTGKILTDKKSQTNAIAPA